MNFIQEMKSAERPPRHPPRSVFTATRACVPLAAVVEPGVVNLDLSRAVAQHGLFYAPDPSSQRACTIDGNVAENAGGPHCLAYGATTNHVLGAELVLADGDVVWVGGHARDVPGYDLAGAFVGSEGTRAS